MWHAHAKYLIPENLFLTIVGLSCVLDPDYLTFLEQLQKAEPEPVPTPDTFLEEIEAREKMLKGQ